MLNHSQAVEGSLRELYGVHRWRLMKLRRNAISRLNWCRFIFTQLFSLTTFRASNRYGTSVCPEIMLVGCPAVTVHCYTASDVSRNHRFNENTFDNLVIRTTWYTLQVQLLQVGINEFKHPFILVLIIEHKLQESQYLMLSQLRKHIRQVDEYEAGKP